MRFLTATTLNSNQTRIKDPGRPALTRNGRMLFWVLLASGRITMRKVDALNGKIHHFSIVHTFRQ
jgi:hypothetical protein